MDTKRTHLYRPLDANTGAHITIDLSDEDQRRVHSEKEGCRGIVTDLRTGIRYRAFGMPCGLPGCSCGAIVVVMPDPNVNGRQLKEADWPSR